MNDRGNKQNYHFQAYQIQNKTKTAIKEPTIIL